MVRPFVHLLDVSICAEKRAYTSSGIYDTSYLSRGRASTQYSWYFPNMVSRHSSHCTRTSRYGTAWTLEQVGFDTLLFVVILPPVCVSCRVDVGKTVELEGDPDKNAFVNAPRRPRQGRSLHHSQKIQTRTRNKIMAKYRYRTLVPGFDPKFFHPV